MHASETIRLAVISNVPDIVGVGLPEWTVACPLARLLNLSILHKMFLYKYSMHLPYCDVVTVRDLFMGAV